MKPKKCKVKLDARVIDYEKMLRTGFPDSGKDGRLRSGGFHRPGSNK